MTKNKKEAIEAEIIENKSTFVTSTSGNGGIFWGFLLIIFGLMLIAELFTSINLWQYFWPSLLIIFGSFIVIRSFRRK